MTDIPDGAGGFITLQNGEGERVGKLQDELSMVLPEVEKNTDVLSRAVAALIRFQLWRFK